MQNRKDDVLMMVKDLRPGDCIRFTMNVNGRNKIISGYFVEHLKNNYISFFNNENLTGTLDKIFYPLDSYVVRTKKGFIGDVTHDIVTVKGVTTIKIHYVWGDDETAYNELNTVGEFKCFNEIEKEFNLKMTEYIENSIRKKLFEEWKGKFNRK